MIHYPQIDPVAFRLGPLQVHWYGLMYLVGFLGAWCLAMYRAKRSQGRWTSEMVSDLIFYSAIGVILGGRLGYVLFYNFSFYLQHPQNIIKLWDGGMSFHGGLIGVMLVTWLFARKHTRPWREVIDFVAPLVPLGLAAGRLGNFINGELWGRVTQVPWGMVFPTGGPLPRHPSQLYEFLLEGVMLFIILWWYSAKPRPLFAVSAMFLIFYGLFRSFVEFFRMPDPQVGYLAFGWVTEGQLLSLPMVLIGGITLWWACRNKERVDG